MYSVFHQSGAGREVFVVDVVVVQRAVGVHVIRVVGIGVRGAQAPVDGGNRPYPFMMKGGYLRPASIFGAARALSLPYQLAHI